MQERKDEISSSSYGYLVIQPLGIVGDDFDSHLQCSEVGDRGEVGDSHIWITL